MAMRTYRGWINQPSSLQPLHDMHGTPCIVQDSGGVTVRVWFISGPVHSLEASRLCISEVKLSNTEG